MISGSRRFVIAFNGEIYNYLAIKNELQRESGTELRLRGGSDTEVHSGGL